LSAGYSHLEEILKSYQYLQKGIIPKECGWGNKVLSMTKAKETFIWIKKSFESQKSMTKDIWLLCQYKTQSLTTENKKYTSKLF
jgi:hypothetical protein